PCRGAGCWPGGCRGGSGDGCRRSRPHLDRHDHGSGARRLPRDGSAAREIRWTLGDMEKEGVSGRAHVITVSDGVSAGIREDVSGRAVVDLLKRARFGVSGPEVVPDTHESITDSTVAAVIAGAVL